MKTRYIKLSVELLFIGFVIASSVTERSSDTGSKRDAVQNLKPWMTDGVTFKAEADGHNMKN
jgi:hypothetical protein